MSKIEEFPAQPVTPAVSFDVDGFDRAIKTQGVKAVHLRAMPCPVGLVDIGSGRQPHSDHEGCSAGWRFTEAGSLTLLFAGNGEDYRQTDVGLIDGSTVQVTTARRYDGRDGDDVHVAVFDRFYVADESVLVPTSQLFEARVDGRDKLRYPVVEVVDLFDSDGREYREGEHFAVRGGFIVWEGSVRPRFDAARSKGQVCSVRYLYRPFYVVSRVVHQVRVAQVETIDQQTGAIARRVVRMPQALVLAREYAFDDADRDPAAARDSGRQVPAARSGSFGPR